MSGDSGTTGRAGFGTAVGWNLAGSALRVGITLACQLLLLRLLGPVPAGQFAVFLAIVGLGSILSEGGMMAVLARAPVLDTGLVRAALFLVLCYSMAIAALLMAVAGLLSRLFGLPGTHAYVPVVAALNVIPLALASVPISMLKQQYRARDVQLIQLGAYTLGFLLVGVPLALATPSVLVLVAAFSVQSLAMLVAAMAVSQCPVLPHWRGAGAIRRTSSRALMGNALFFANESAATLFSAHALGAHATGLYSTAYNLLRTPTDVVAGALHAPLMVAAAREGDRADGAERFLSVLNVLATTMLAVFVVGFLCGPQIVSVLLGPKWQDAGPVLSIVSLIMAARLFGTVAGAVAWGRGQLLRDMGAQAAGLAVLLGGLWLVRPATATALAAAVLAASAVRAGVQIGVAVRASGVGARALARALIVPAIVTVAAMLPMGWIGPALVTGSGISGESGLAGFLALGAVAALLLAMRVALALWWSPFQWAVLVRQRLARGRVRRPVGSAALIGGSK